jgi:hypothetical protein
MTASPKHEVPTRYEIRIGGHLDQRWSAWFDDLTLSHEGDGTTRLCGVVPDQAALFGVLTKVRDLGIVLISVEAVEAVEAMDSADADGKVRDGEQRDGTSRQCSSKTLPRNAISRKTSGG